MKIKTIVFVFIVCFSHSILVNAEITTTDLFADSDTLPSGYFVYYTRTISQSSTTVRVTISSSDNVDVAICGGGDFVEWNDGGPEPYWHAYSSNVTSITITEILNSGSYDFVIINFGLSTISYTISATQSYDVGGSGLEPGDWIYGLIGLGVLAIIIGTIVFRRRRRQQMATQPGYYQQQQTYQPQRTYEPQQTYQTYQAAEQPPSAFSQTQQDLKVCPNCGFNEDLDAKFCTSCGSKL